MVGGSDISNLLLTWEGFRKKDFRAPYIYSISNGKQELLYIGTKHSYNPSDFMFEVIRREWEEFYERNKGRDIIVVTEGGVRSVRETEEEAILKGGEMSFITYLAAQKNIRTVCYEPERGKIFRELEKLHGREEIFYERMATVLLQYNTLILKPPFDKYMGQYFMEDKRDSGWHDFDFSMDNLKVVHKKLFGSEFDETAKRFFYDAIDPAQDNFITNQISRDEDKVRDTSIVKGILSEWQKGRSIFSLHGSGHAVIQEPALREVLK